MKLFVLEAIATIDEVNKRNEVTSLLIEAGVTIEDEIERASERTVVEVVFACARIVLNIALTRIVVAVATTEDNTFLETDRTKLFVALVWAWNDLNRELNLLDTVEVEALYVCTNDLITLLTGPVCAVKLRNEELIRDNDAFATIDDAIALNNERERFDAVEADAFIVLAITDSLMNAVDALIEEVTLLRVDLVILLTDAL